MKKENIPLIVAIGLPLILILLVAALTYLPKVLSNPQYNFLYTENLGGRYYSYVNETCVIYKKYYEVGTDNKLTLKDYYISQFEGDPEIRIKEPCQGQPTIFKDMPDVYLYDVKSDTATKITPEAVVTYTVVAPVTSPDGYKVSYRYGHDGIFELFGGSNDNGGLFLMKKSPIRKLNVETNSISDMNYGSREIKFLGWVK